MMLFAHAIKMKRPCATDCGFKRQSAARALAAAPPPLSFKHVPRKIRQLAADLVRAGFVQVPGSSPLPGKAIESRAARSERMKPADHYLKFVRWEEDDCLYVGYCPDLFPWGGVCHAAAEVEVYSQLCALVQDEVTDLLQSGQPLPPGTTRAMRDAIPA